MAGLKRFPQNQASYKPVLAIFFLVCVITSVFSFQYYNQLQSAITEESHSYLQEIARRTGNGINRIISDNYAALHTVASVLETFEVDSFETLSPIAKTQKKHWSYEELFLIDERGRAYNTNGEEVPLNNDAYFDQAVINKQQGLSTTQMINNVECILLAVPMKNLKIQQTKMVALAASYRPVVFEQTLSMSAFNGQSYACIINKSGTMVVRPAATGSIKFGYNVLSTIEACITGDSSKMSTVRQHIIDDQAGQVEFSQNDTRHYMVYIPLNPEGWYLTTFVPTKVVNEKSDMLLVTTLVLCGVITLTFAGLLAVLIFVSSRNKQKLEQIAYVDEVTGGNTIQRFYLLANDALADPDHPSYALVYTNIQKFKLLNEQFGRGSCDELLKAFYQLMDKSLHEKECIGRLTGDNFCLLLHYEGEDALTKRLEQWFRVAEKFVIDNKQLWSLPTAEFGVFIIDESALPFPQMIDRAKLAIREFSRMINGKLRYAIYNNQAHQKLFREKKLEDMMEQALKNREFQVYLQPKYALGSDKIGGAEALARWQSASEGMIFPNEFIPLFEKNGFIVELDLYMFEEVCMHLRRWLDAGLQPVKISVNCSRVHLNSLDFLDTYRDLAKKHHIPPEYIELELTESVVLEDVDRLAKVIDDIHALGFGCSMDDFGSGYSSLNLIQSIPVDTLKVDRIFFRDSDAHPARTESVVGSIVSMAKALSMDTVAEGVESPDQVAMLRRIGCDYVQGYVFAKPMPIDQFEALVFDRIKE